MARYFANPNPYSKILDRKFLRYNLSIMSAMLGMALAFWVSKANTILAGLFGYSFLGLFLYLIYRVFKQIAKNDRGEDAEIEVRKILGILSNNYIVFQNVPIKKNLDIDLVLVGPTGVYAIEVKSYRKFYQYYGSTDFIGQTMSEALGLKNYLKDSGVDVFVNAVLVFSRAFVKFGFTPQRGVYVIGKKFLIPLLGRGREINFDQLKTEAKIMSLYETQITKV